MKTKLLSLIITTLLFTSTLNAQTKTWNFSTDTTNFPDSGGSGGQVVKDNLGLYASAPDAATPITTFAGVNNNNYPFPDGFSATRRMQFGGAGYTGTTFMAMPTQRFAFFNVAGTCTVKVWFRPSSANTLRSMYVTNGTTTYGSAISGGTGADYGIVTASYTGGASQLYVFGDAGVNVYKIEVTGTTVTTAVLANKTFNQSNLNVVAANKQVNISNVNSATEVNVYNMTGALVKNLKIEADTTFDLQNSGLYVVNAKSADGEKSVKVLIK